MGHSTLLLRLAGPMQSWGVKSRFDRRDTGLEPSKSGVVGLLCSALGRDRSADLSDLAGLEMGVRADEPGVLAVDYQTVEGVPPASGKGNLQTVQSYRWYLADAVFLVALSGPGEVIAGARDALERPRWLMALGRKSYVPTPPVVIGTTEMSVGEALRSTPWLASSARSRARAKRSGRVDARVVRDCAPDDAHEWRQDLPVSFEPRRFLRRPVRLEQVRLEGELLERECVWSST